MHEEMKYLGQSISTFIDPQNPSLAKEQFDGNPG